METESVVSKQDGFYRKVLYDLLPPAPPGLGWRTDFFFSIDGDGSVCYDLMSSIEDDTIPTRASVYLYPQRGQVEINCYSLTTKGRTSRVFDLADPDLTMKLKTIVEGIAHEEAS
jgi:hypothetical protein